jgi:nucleoid-associated protein YgaU
MMKYNKIIFGIIVLVVIVLLALFQYQNKSNDIVDLISASIENDKHKLDQITSQDNLINITAEENILPTFDIVRVDTNSVSVIAGQSESNAEIAILDNNVIIAKGKANSEGEWVIIIEKGQLTDDILNLTVSAKSEKNDKELVSKQIITIMSNELDAKDTLVSEDKIILMIEQGKPTKLLNEKVIEDNSMVNLKSVDYSDSGAMVSGNASPLSQVNAYLDNDFIGTTFSDSKGNWTLNLDSNIIPGEYELRVDQLDEDSFVIARASTSFSRLVNLIPLDENFSGKVLIKPGDNLWNIARDVYGSGFEYTVLFLANNNQIINPDLIYPGQVLMLPGND